jgi:peroxiredoxin Q/BCP
MAHGVQVGDKAPDFTLPAQSGAPVRLRYRLGERVVVLYFYPKDDTRGCTAEACAFRDSYGVPAVAGLLPGRVTYVIDRRGMVRHVFNSMTNISQHVDDALEVVRQLQAELRA